VLDTEFETRAFEVETRAENGPCRAITGP